MEDLRLVADEREQMDSGAGPRVPLSVLVPISDRVDDLRRLHRVYTDALALTGRTFELIYVLDGPQPAALASLREMKAHDPSIHVLTMHRYFGEGTASIGSTNSPPMHLMGCLVWGSVRMGEFLGVELNWNKTPEDEPQSKLVVASGATLPGPGRVIS